MLLVAAAIGGIAAMLVEDAPTGSAASADRSGRAADPVASAPRVEPDPDRDEASRSEAPAVPPAVPMPGWTFAQPAQGDFEPPWVEIEVVDARTRRPIEDAEAKLVFAPPEKAVSPPGPWSPGVDLMKSSAAELLDDPDPRKHLQPQVLAPGKLRLPWIDFSTDDPNGPSPAAPWKIAARVLAYGYQRGATPWISFDGRSAYGPFTVALTPLGVITGTLRTSRGEPVAGASVTLLERVSGDFGNWTGIAGIVERLDYRPISGFTSMSRSVSGESGRYEVQVERSGEFLLRVATEDRCLDQSQPFAASADGTTQFDFTLGGSGSIEGTALGADGEPIGTLEEIVAARDDGLVVSTCVVDPEGSYELGPLPPGRYRVRVGGRDFDKGDFAAAARQTPRAPRDAAAYDVVVRDGVVARCNIDLRVPAGTLVFGTVRVEGGMPPDCRVTLSPRDAGSGELPWVRWMPQPRPLASTGAYRLVDFPDGPSRLEVWVGGERVAAREVVVVPHQPLRFDFDLALARCSGRFVGDRGEPLPALAIEVFDKSHPESEPLRRIGLPAESGGAFAIEGLARALYELRVRAAGPQRSPVTFDADLRGGSIDLGELRVVPGG